MIRFQVKLTWKDTKQVPQPGQLSDAFKDFIPVEWNSIL